MKPYLKWVLAASIAVNIVLAGFVIGRFVPPPFHRHQEELAESLKKLSPEKRVLFETMMKNAHARKKERFKQVQEIRKEVVAILVAPTFDEDAFLAKSKQLDAFFSIGKQQMIADMAAIARQCNQEERKILAEHLRRPPPPMGPPPGVK